MSESILSPLHSERVFLEETKKPSKSKRITFKKTSNVLKNDSEDMFDPLSFNIEQQKAYKKMVKARKNYEDAQDKYNEALSYYRSLFTTTKGGRKTRGRKYL